MAQGIVNALFKFLNSAGLILRYATNPFTTNFIASQGLICLPESVISHDVSFVVDRKCGSRAADLVRDYYLYFRTRFNGALSMIGFSTNICDDETRRKPAIDTIYSASDDPESGGTFSRLFDHFLEENSPGTAMDTVFGEFVRTDIKMIPDRIFCDPNPFLGVSFQACLLLSYDASGKASFNVLQYAHALVQALFTPCAGSSSLKIFRSCFNILKHICGANATYFEYNYHMSAGRMEIQRMMDNLTCKWQDMLIQQYIIVEESEHKNTWSSTENVFGRPMYLSTGRHTLGSLTLCLLLFLSARCSVASAKRVKLFYDRLQYNWYTQIKLLNMQRGKYDTPSPVWYI